MEIQNIGMLEPNIGHFRPFYLKMNEYELFEVFLSYKYIKNHVHTLFHVFNSSFD